MCEYLHQEHFDVREVVGDDKVVGRDEENDVTKHVENAEEKEKCKTDNKEMQTDNESHLCICKNDVIRNEMFIKEDKIICLFKRVECDEEEWQEVEETVKDSGMDLDEMLDQWSKVMEGYYRVEQKEA